MMRKTIVIIGLILTLVGLNTPIGVLEVRDVEQKEVLYQQRANVGEHFDVEWIHSVTKRPVIETYKIIDENRISLEKMIFDENGPNLPVGPYGEQSFVLREDGWFEVSNYNLEFSTVPVTIGMVISDHTLVYNGVSTKLKEVYRPGGHVDIYFVKKPIWNYLIEEVSL